MCCALAINGSGSSNICESKLNTFVDKAAFYWLCLLSLSILIASVALLALMLMLVLLVLLFAPSVFMSRWLINNFGISTAPLIVIYKISPPMMRTGSLNWNYPGFYASIVNDNDYVDPD